MLVLAKEHKQESDEGSSPTAPDRRNQRSRWDGTAKLSSLSLLIGIAQIKLIPPTM